jgi:MscS family membrane protein
MKQEILSILKSHPNIDQNKTIAVSLASGNTMIGNKSEGSFGSNGINLQIYAMVNKVFFADFVNTQDDVFLAIAKKLNSLDIEFAINPVTIRKKY